MFNEIRRGRQKYGLKKYLQRRVKAKIDEVFFSSDADDLYAALRDVGIRPDTRLCVHSSLSRLGHIDGGAIAVIDALKRAVGERGLLAMPAFSMGGSMERHLREQPVFDVARTPSLVGLIPETFRRMPGVERSCHPTSSVAAWGRGAREFLAGHENSATPYGYDTPYGRLAAFDDSYVLMLDTHLHSLLHHIQERVEFPNLFLANKADTTVIDNSGARKTVRTKVMRERIPYFVAIPGVTEGHPQWAILHDYALMFPSRRYKEVKRMGYNFSGFPELVDRRRRLESEGILRTRRLGRGEIGLLHVKPFVEYLQPEFESLIERYREHYRPDDIAGLGLPYS